MTQPEAAALSIVIEAPVAAMLAATWAWARPADPRLDPRRGALVAGLFAAGVATAGTLLTHPLVWTGALALYQTLGRPLTLAVVETGAVLGEALLYAAVLPRARALPLSLAANATSALIGAVLVG